MDLARLKVAGALWTDILEGRKWNDERLKLESILWKIRNDRLSLNDLQTLVNQLRSNNFLRDQIAPKYQEHEASLKEMTHLLEELSLKRKQLSQSLFATIIRTRRFTLQDGTVFECDFSAGPIKERLTEILGRYSSEVVSKQFDPIKLLRIADDISLENESQVLTSRYLERLVRMVVLLLESEDIDENELRKAIRDLLGELIRIGHKTEDLGYWGTTLCLGGPSPEDIITLMVSSLLSPPKKWLVLTGIEDLELADDQSVAVGNLTLRGVDHSFSFPIKANERAIDHQVLKDLVTPQLNALRGNVTCETQTMAFGSQQARLLAWEEISKCVDVLGIIDPNSVIREPREQRHHKTIAFDEDMRPALEAGTRTELHGKRLDSGTLASLDKILAVTQSTLNKRPEELTEFERRFLTALHFYRRANYSFEPIDKVVNYVVALESMLIKRDERPSVTLLKRIPEVLWVITEHRSRLKNPLRKAYHLRGQILHSGLRNKRESETASRELLEINRKVLAIIINYLSNRGVTSLKEFLEKSHEDAAAHRANVLQNALLDVNQTYSGQGKLNSAVSIIGKADFSFSYKDDGKYVSMEGFITKVELLGSISQPGSVLEGSFDGVTKKFKLELATPVDQLDVFELAGGRVERLPFRVRAISTV